MARHRCPECSVRNGFAILRSVPALWLRALLGCRRGIVVHVMADALVDLTTLLRRIGEREGDPAFPVPVGRGDAVRGGGGPDRREVEAPTPRRRDIYIPDLALGSGIKVPVRNFR